MDQQKSKELLSLSRLVIVLSIIGFPWFALGAPFWTAPVSLLSSGLGASLWAQHLSNDRPQWVRLSIGALSLIWTILGALGLGILLLGHG